MSVLCKGGGVWESIAFRLTLSMCMSVGGGGGGGVGGGDLYVHWPWAPSVYADYCNNTICKCQTICAT